MAKSAFEKWFKKYGGRYNNQEEESAAKDSWLSALEWALRQAIKIYNPYCHIIPIDKIKAEIKKVKAD